MVRGAGVPQARRQKLALAEVVFWKQQSHVSRSLSTASKQGRLESLECHAIVYLISTT